MAASAAAAVRPRSGRSTRTSAANWHGWSGHELGLALSSRAVAIAHDASALPCLVAVDGERWLGVAVYALEDGECELVLLEAFERRAGIGTALLEATVAIARKSNSRRLWLVTTNDNLDALRFYQRRGMHLVSTLGGCRRTAKARQNFQARDTANRRVRHPDP